MPRNIRATLAWLALVVLSGCVQPQVTSERIEPIAPPEPPRPHKDAVAIVISSNAPAYMDIARALAEELDRAYLRYSLDTASADVIREIIQREQHRQVIAVGLKATQAMAPLGPDQLIYCQVFYDAALREQRFRGVSAVPPFALQLDYWQDHAGRLRTIGVVAGPDSRDLIEQLKAAAGAYGIEVHHEEVSSDKQALFVYQRLIPEIDGYLFLPDTAVLSPGVIRKMMRYGSKHGKSLLVYNPMLLEIGASLLVMPDPYDVAHQVMALLDQEEPLAAPLRELTTLEIRRPGQQRLALLDRAAAGESR